MIRLTLAMLAARRGAALTVFLLAVIAAAAAASGPLYRAAAAGSVTATELAAAEPAELVIRTGTVVHHDRPQRASSTDLNQPVGLRPGFDAVVGVQVAGRGSTPALADRALSLNFRTGACQHLVAVSGRCVSGASEIMLSVATAAEMRLPLGGTLTFRSGAGAGDLPNSGPPVPLTLVGTYQPTNSRDGYWAGRLFGPGTNDWSGSGGAAFVTRETIANTPFADANVSVDLVAQRAMFDDPDRLRAAVGAETASKGWNRSVQSDIPAVLTRIAASEAALADGVRLAAVPLVLLCWFVLYLAVAGSAFRRRGEFGLAGLRGAPRLARWWLSTVEYLVPLVAGGLVGYLAAYLLGTVLAGRLLPGDPTVRPTLDSVWYAAAAVGGALAVGVVAQWRAAAAPVASLLRRVPARQPVSRLSPVEVVVVVLAVGAGYQVYSGGGGGIALLTPTLVALAVGLVASRLVGAVADRIGRRGLRRGRLGRTLACLYLARQPSQSRLLGVLVTMFAVLGFAVTAAEVGADGASARVRTELGAARVLQVERVRVGQLMSAVQAADPDGRYAMAVSRLPSGATQVLGVDASRLARVAIWPGGGPSAAEVARQLEPAEASEVRLDGASAELRLTVAAVPEGTTLRATLLAPSGPIEVDFGALRPGTASYRAATPACVDGGCRLLRLRPGLPLRPEYHIDLTVRELRQLGPDRVVVDPAGFARADRWAAGEAGATGSAVADGYRVVYTARPRMTILLRAVGAPGTLPVASVEPLPVTLDAGGGARPVTRVAELRLVPGLGPAGALVSLRYADLVATDPSISLDSEVWLTADAPPSVLDRLREAGLVVRSDRTVSGEVDRLGHRGPALALRFFLMVAVASVALGVGGLAVVAIADRWAQAAQLRGLRAQGLPPAVAWRVGFGAYGALTAVGLVLGAGAGALAWWLSRSVVPFFLDAGGGAYLPVTPAPVPVVLALGGAALVLLAAAAVAATALRRAVEGVRT